MIDSKEYHYQIERQKAKIRLYTATRDYVDTEYYHAIIILEKMVAKGWRDENYREKFVAWTTNKVSTIALRELGKEVGHDYWTNLTESNALDYLDSASCFNKNLN